MCENTWKHIEIHGDETSVLGVWRWRGVSVYGGVWKRVEIHRETCGDVWAHRCRVMCLL